MSLISTLKSYAGMTNIAEEADLDKELLTKLGQRVLTGFNQDFASCSQWLEDIKKVEELSSLVTRPKNFPLPNSSNVKMPIITKACYEFSSRTYPEIVKDGKIVKGRVIGMAFTEDKQERAERVSDYMNYQLLFLNEEWELELDRLLHLLSLIGFVCKKTYYDKVRKIIKSELCEPKDLIINSDVKSLDDARRISHIIHLRLNDLIEQANSGIFLKEPVDELIEEHEEDELDPVIDVIEQHTFLDLDEDCYSEPYIVTILKESGKILRIAPRFSEDDIEGSEDKIKYINPIQLFTDYHFLVSPKGKFQSMGFGILLLHLNESINSILNMLIDSGQLSNLRGGYKDSRLKNMGSGDSLHDPGEMKTVKAMAGVTLKEGMMFLDYKEPSSVLFQLLGLLIQTSKELSSSTEVMTGATDASNAKTGAVNALQQQGIKIFTSIQKRIYRSLTNEFRKIYRLDSLYLDPETYYNVIDDRKHVKQDDFDLKSVDVIPTADPNLSSDIQRSYRNQILLAAQQLPGTDKVKLSRFLLQNSNLGIPVEDIMMSPEQMNQPNPEMIKLQADIKNMSETNALKGHELALREKEIQIEEVKVQGQLIELRARALLEIAQAAAQQDQGKIKQYELQLDIITKQLEAMQHAAEFGQANAMHSNEMGMRQQELDQNQQEIDNNVQSGQSVDASSGNQEAASAA